MKISKQGLSKQQSATYEGALEAVLAVPIAMGLGYWADSRFESGPVGLIVGAVIGFLAMLLRITRMRPKPSDLQDLTSTASEEDNESNH